MNDRQRTAEDMVATFDALQRGRVERAAERKALEEHRPEPQYVSYGGEDYLRQRCRVCDQIIQRRGLLHRWRHVR